MNSFHMTMVLKYGVKEMSVANKYSGAVLWTALKSLQHCSGEGEQPPEQLEQYLVTPR